MQRHVVAHIAQAHAAAIPVGVQAEVNLAVRPGIAQLVGRDGHRPNAWAGRLCTAPTRCQLLGLQAAQAQVLASISRRTPSSARAGGLAAGMSAVMAPDRLSKVQPWASSASGMGCNAPCMASPARPNRSGCARHPRGLAVCARRGRSGR